VTPGHSQERVVPGYPQALPRYRQAYLRCPLEPVTPGHSQERVVPGYPQALPRYRQAYLRCPLEPVTPGHSRERVVPGCPRERVVPGCPRERVVPGCPRERVVPGCPRERVVPGCPRERVVPGYLPQLALLVCRREWAFLGYFRAQAPPGCQQGFVGCLRARMPLGLLRVWASSPACSRGRLAPGCLTGAAAGIAPRMPCLASLRRTQQRRACHR
jgi:hypothetical protein